jgi:hypothetical protein
MIVASSNEDGGHGGGALKGRSSPMRRRFFTFRGTPAAKANSFASGRATEPPAAMPLGGHHVMAAD